MMNKMKYPCGRDIFLLAPGEFLGCSFFFPGAFLN
jgi:hypothetical protein